MLRELIERNRQNVTTLIVIYVVLEDYISCKTENIVWQGLTVPEIGRKYGELASMFSRKERFIKPICRDMLAIMDLLKNIMENT